MKRKSIGWAGVLTLIAICLGASLYAQGVVGFWRMFFIMMVPNIGFYLRDAWRGYRDRMEMR